jgi:hypothetical protein
MRTFEIDSQLQNIDLRMRIYDFWKAIQINTKWTWLVTFQILLLYRFVELRDGHKISKMNK